MTGDNVLFWNWYVLRVKKNSSHAHKNRILVPLSKFPMSIGPRPIYMRIPPGVPPPLSFTLWTPLKGCPSYATFFSQCLAKTSNGRSPVMGSW